MSPVTRKTRYVDLPELITPEELSEYLHVSRNGAYELLRTAAIPSLRYGRLIRIPKTALLVKDQK